jgi:hypothetical protein
MTNKKERTTVDMSGYKVCGVHIGSRQIWSNKLTGGAKKNADFAILDGSQLDSARLQPPLRVKSMHVIWAILLTQYGCLDYTEVMGNRFLYWPT